MVTLVTGAGGFLGGEIVRQLVERDTPVRVLVRREHPELKQLPIDIVSADLADRDAVIAACQGVDCVHHVAAIAGVWGSWDKYYRANVLGTQHVIDGCLAHGVPKLVFTSSPSVTFDGTDQEGVDESVPYSSEFLANYPRSKAMAEQLVLGANGTRNGGGQLATCALRPHLIWGPADPHLLPRVVERARAGRLRRIGDGKNLVDVIHVTNAAAGQIAAGDALALDSPVAGRAYFLSQGEPVNLWDWVNQILGLADVPPITKSISASWAYRIGSTLETIYRLLGRKDEPPMTRFVAAQLSTSHWYNIDRARQDFGYQPQISMDDGLRQLAQAWRRNRP